MIFIAIIVLIFAVDFVIKNYFYTTAKGQIPTAILGNKIVLRHVENKGLAFNLLSGRRYLPTILSMFTLAALIVSGVSIFFKKTVPTAFKLGLSFIIGGASSNVFDRFVRGSVTDYFSFNIKKLNRLKKVFFNISDMFIIIGGIIIVVKQILVISKNK